MNNILKSKYYITELSDDTINVVGDAFQSFKDALQKVRRYNGFGHCRILKGNVILDAINPDPSIHRNSRNPLFTISFSAVTSKATS